MCSHCLSAKAFSSVRVDPPGGEDHPAARAPADLVVEAQLAGDDELVAGDGQVGEEELQAAVETGIEEGVILGVKIFPIIGWG